jgi:23S rRNA (cytosine1962-C5)-methyltransferase
LKCGGTPLSPFFFMQQRQTITVNNRGAERIKKGHLWIYRSDIKNTKQCKGGAVVSVVDERNRFVGKAFYSDRSEIALRFLTTKDEPIDRQWWRRKFLEAAQRRADYKQNTNAYRLINSEGDLMSSLIVDVYDGVFVIQTLSQGAESLLPLFVDLLKEEFQPRAIIERNDVKVRELEGLELRTSTLFGDVPDEIVIEQDGVKFFVSPLSGQKTGSFLDQRENHFAVCELARGRALDCFTFNGGFALNLAKSCESVVAIDISDEAIALAKRNAELNQTTNITFQTANVFDALREFEKKGERFDTIVLDPPAFAKNRASVKAALRGYKEINLRALKLLNKNGLLVSCSCSYHATEDLFLSVIEEAANDAGRRVQLVEKRTQSRDHPILLCVPETYYLKCIVLKVME